MAVVGTEDKHRVFPQILAVHGIQHLAKPVINHTQFSTVIGADVLTLAGGYDSAFDRINGIGRPDHLLTLPVWVIFVRPRRGRIKGLVGIKLIDKQKKTVVSIAMGREPVCSCLHSLRTGEIQLFTKPGSG